MTGSTLQLLSFAAPSDREEQKKRAERQMQRDRWRANEMVTDRVEHNAVEWSSTKLDLDSLAPQICGIWLEPDSKRSGADSSFHLVKRSLTV